MTRLDRVRELSEQQLSNREIAAHLGLKSTRQVTRLKRLAGIPPANGAPLSESVRTEIRRLSEEEGWPPGEIAATLGVSQEAAGRWSTRGPGEEWSAIASRLATTHRTLWQSLQ